jgi:hypothetical protein
MCDVTVLNVYLLILSIICCFTGFIGFFFVISGIIEIIIGSLLKLKDIFICSAVVGCFYYFLEIIKFIFLILISIIIFSPNCWNEENPYTFNVKIFVISYWIIDLSILTFGICFVCFCCR